MIQKIPNECLANDHGYGHFNFNGRLGTVGT